MTINDFIKERPSLVWSTRNYENLSVDAIVEAVLNQGDWNDFKQLVKILGLKEVAAVFRRGLKKKRCNYRPAIKNYFQLYFNKYVPE
jgi:hypothetical protein